MFMSYPEETKSTDVGAVSAIRDHSHSAVRA